MQKKHISKQTGFLPRLLLLLAAGLISAFAGQDYHVSVNGDDNTGDGSSGNPWATLKHACSEVAADSGHTIRLGAGTFEDDDRLGTETPATLPRNVSLVGEGKELTTYIGQINVPSVNDQTISDFKMDGWENTDDLFSNYVGLVIKSGDSLTVTRLRIEGYYSESLLFGDWTGLSNSSLSYCELINNGRPDRRGFAMRTGGLTNVEIHHNTLLEERGKGSQNWNTGDKILTNVKVHHNTFRTHRDITAGWKNQPPMNLEWVQVDALNCEIYENTFNDLVSLVDRDVERTGKSPYSVRVHNNRWDYTLNYSIEATMDKLEIDHNYFHFGEDPDIDTGGGYAAISNSTAVVNDLKIHHNVFDGVPWIAINNPNGDRLQVYNNTFRGATRDESPNYLKNYTPVFLRLRELGTHEDWIIKNNVMTADTDRTGHFMRVYPDKGVSDPVNATISNNVMFNTISNWSTSFAAQSGVDEPVLADPQFVSSGFRPDPWFRPDTGSPLVDEGVVVPGITDGFSGLAPDIGRYESETTVGNVVLTENFSSYSDQDKDGTATLNSPSSLTLTGNRWRKFPFAYTVTPDTILEFSVSATDTGEFLAIGFDNDNIHSNQKRAFQFAGSQNWGTSEKLLPTYVANSGIKTYSVRVGDYFTGAMQYLVFVADDDSIPSSANVTFSDIAVYEDVPSGPGAPVQFASADFIAYGSEDGKYGQPTNISVGSGGTEFTLTGNAWKSAAFSYNVVAETVMEFTINAPNAGEFVGIALDSDNLPTNLRRAFIAGGSQHGGSSSFSWSLTPKYISGEGLATYVVPVGTFFTGQVNRIGLIADDDASGAANVTYSNIRIYEPGDSIAFSAADFVSYGSSQDGANSLPTAVGLGAGGKTVLLSGNAWKAAPLSYQVTASTILEVTVAASDVGEFIGISLDNDLNPTNSMRAFIIGGSDYKSASWCVAIAPQLGSGDPSVTYQIPVGTHFTGTVNHIGFIGDDDADGSTDAAFSSIRIYEP